MLVDGYAEPIYNNFYHRISDRFLRGCQTAALTGKTTTTREVDDILADCYGLPERKPAHADPVCSLGRSLLSQNTSDRNSDRAFASLAAAFPAGKGKIDWHLMASAPRERIARAIRSGGLAGQKSERIQQALQWIRSAYGAFTLQPVCGMEPDDAIALLTRHKGVGVKTAAVVLAFSCGMDLFPVDTHVHRVCRRLGLVGEKDSADRTFWQMRHRVPEGRGVPLHMNMIRLGREICRPANPRCTACPLGSRCNWAAENR